MKFLISAITSLLLLASCAVTTTPVATTAPTTQQVVQAAITPAVEAATYLYLTKSVLASNKIATEASLKAVANAASAFASTGSTFTPTQLQQYLLQSVPAASNVYASAAINLFLAELQLYLTNVSVTVSATSNAALVQAVAQGILAGVTLAG